MEFRGKDRRNVILQDYSGPEKRSDTFRISKEIPLSWLITFLVGGIANFASIIWIAATLVSDIKTIKSIVDKHEAFTVEVRIEKDKQFIQNITQDTRLNSHDTVLATHGERIKGVESRVFR